MSRVAFFAEERNVTVSGGRLPTSDTRSSNGTPTSEYSKMTTMDQIILYNANMEVHFHVRMMHAHRPTLRSLLRLVFDSSFLHSHNCIGLPG